MTTSGRRAAAKAARISAAASCGSGSGGTGSQPPAGCAAAGVGQRRFHHLARAHEIDRALGVGAGDLQGAPGELADVKPVRISFVYFM